MARQPTAPDALAGMLDEAQRRVATLQQLEIEQQEAWRQAKDRQAGLLEEAAKAKDAGLKRLRQQEDAAGRLLAALGAAATSTGYGETATVEKQDADRWRRVAMAAGAVGAGVAVFLLRNAHAADWRQSLTRISVTLPFALLAIYAGRQAAGHRTEQRNARRLQLAFGSVDAYLADLDAIPRAELKRELSSSLFAGRNVPTETGDYPSSADLVELLSQTIKKLR